MTTIAWDGRYLAADTRVTADGDLLDDNCEKIIRFHKPIKYMGDELLIGAFSGMCNYLYPFIEYLYEEKPIKKWEHELGGIIVGKHFIYTIEHNSGYLTLFEGKTPIADGSGMYYALSAMKLGFNAMDAVNHASTINLSTNNKINYVDCSKQALTIKYRDYSILD